MFKNQLSFFSFLGSNLLLGQTSFSANLTLGAYCTAPRFGIYPHDEIVAMAIFPYIPETHKKKQQFILQNTPKTPKRNFETYFQQINFTNPKIQKCQFPEIQIFGHFEHFITSAFAFQLFGTELAFRANLLLGKPPSRGLLYCATIRYASA